jgi:heme ABC exporter ATP-binding subunit CcmA
VPVVQLREVVALLGRFPALAGLDLEVAAGEAVLLQGPNGAGKTTLLRVCAGLVPVDAGTAQVLGHDLVKDRRAVRREVGMLAHATYLYDDLTVLENLRFWARAAGGTVAEAEAAMARLEIDPRLRDVSVARLSTGQRRRASLAVLVARRPRLWLLDEPHAGLDQAGRDIVDSLVQAAVAAGATVLVASHELERTRTIASRVVTIAGGVVVDDHPAAGVAAAAATTPAVAAPGTGSGGGPDAA